MTETEKFMEWYVAEKAKGLIGLNFFIQAASGTTVENVFAEINQAIEAPTIDSTEF